MWIRNCWHVAAFADEVGAAILPRKFLNQAVVMWRAPDNSLVAMEDRCPHRLGPLSKGFLREGRLTCGYHGLAFDASGACVHAPGQTELPRVKAKTFPLVERDGLAWIWLGESDLADPALVPDVHWMKSPGWTVSRGYHHIKADYRLINDNLLDLSHETYVHKETIGNSAVADAPVVVVVEEGRVVRAHREMPNIDPPPFFAMLLNHTGKINRFQIAIHLPPGVNMTEAGVYKSDGRREDAFVIRVPHLITPETEHSAHYHWGVCRNFRHDDSELTEGIRKGTSHTFDEDKAMLEIQDAALRAEGMPDLPRAAIKVDVAPMRARKLLADFCRAETEDPRAVLRPAPLAYDDRVSWPPRG